MKALKSISFSFWALTTLGLLFTGCSQKPVANQSETGCCEKCGAEQLVTDQTPAFSADLSNGPFAKLETACEGGCCVDTTSNETSEVKACEGGCEACVEGNSADCKCGNDFSTDTKPAESGQVATRVNSMPEDRDIFHFLLENHEKITRTVTELENGVKTLTESTDKAIAKKIQEHVASMYRRVEEGRPLRMWDELYREIFKHADKIKMEIQNTDNGISVTETSDDEYVVKLIKAHAKVVTGFTKRGFEEAHKNHEPPAK